MYVLADVSVNAYPSSAGMEARFMSSIRELVVFVGAGGWYPEKSLGL